MNNIFDDIMSSVRERLSSPLMPSFVIAWVIWNYKFLLIILSDNSISVTFDLIQMYAFGSIFDVISKGFAYPFISSCAYILIYPYPAKILFAFHRARQRDLRKVKQDIEKEELLSVAEADEMRSRFFTETSNLRGQISKLDQDIRLKDSELQIKNSVISKKDRDIEELKSKLDKFNEKNISYPSDGKHSLSKDQEKIILEIARRFSKNSDGSIDKNDKFFLDFSDQFALNFNIKDLIGKNLIRESSKTEKTGYTRKYLELTHDGASIAMKLRDDIVPM